MVSKFDAGDGEAKALNEVEATEPVDEEKTDPDVGVKHHEMRPPPMPERELVLDAEGNQYAVEGETIIDGKRYRVASRATGLPRLPDIDGRGYARIQDRGRATGPAGALSGGQTINIEHNMLIVKTQEVDREKFVREFAWAQERMFDRFPLAPPAEDEAPQSASPEEVEATVDRVASDLARGKLTLRTHVFLSAVDVLLVVLGWRVWVYVTTDYAPRRSHVSDELDVVDFGQSETVAELRAPAWWERLRSLFRRTRS